MKAYELLQLRQFFKKISVKAGSFAVLGIMTALIAAQFSGYVSSDLSKLVGGNTVNKVLTIIASSMLAVVTFSLSVMVNAYANASSSTTPRATKLLLEDSQAQTSLSVFLGAFVYSIVSLVALGTGYYGPEGRVILFGFTGLLIFLIIYTFVKTIEQLSRLGLVKEMMNRIETVTSESLKQRAVAPTIGCCKYDLIPQEGKPIKALRSGYIQMIHPRPAEELAKELGIEVFLSAEVGEFVTQADTIAYVKGDFDPKNEEVTKRIGLAFAIGPNRTFEFDPRYGLTVMSEVALKALSPGINDQGTAIDVIHSQTRMLSDYFEQRKNAETDTCKYPHVHAREISLEGCFEDAFDSIARDAAGNLHVSLELHRAFKSLHILAGDRVKLIIDKLAIRSYKRSLKEMKIQEDIKRLEPFLICNPSNIES